MARSPKSTAWTRYRPAIATIGILVPLVGWIVWSSLQVSVWECVVCMRFEGSEACGTVTGATREEALRTGVDNACAQLTSGMTRTLRCTRTPPLRTTCTEP